MPIAIKLCDVLISLLKTVVESEGNGPYDEFVINQDECWRLNVNFDNHDRNKPTQNSQCIYASSSNSETDYLHTGIFTYGDSQSMEKMELITSSNELISSNLFALK